jgi:15-cis-phytoene synthase
VWVSLIANPDRLLALAYAPSKDRARLTAAFALDEALGQVVAATREPLLGEIRLTWWRDQLLSDAPSVMPMVQALDPVDRLALSPMIEGWAAVLDPLPLNDVQLTRYAQRRGGTLFGAFTATPSLIALGEGWALADFAMRCSDGATAALCQTLAAKRLDPAVLRGVARAHLPFGVLARLAQGDVRDGLPRKHALGAPRRAFRAALYAALRR